MATGRQEVDSSSVWPRVLGRVAGTEPGPTLLVIAGIHGNEKAGVEAARRVLAALRRVRLRRGELVVLLGNTQALAAGQRFLDRDLNRQWSDSRIAALRARPADAPSSREDREQLGLLDAIEDVLCRDPAPMVVDLHTTSANGIPFSMVMNHGSDESFALCLPLPIIKGLLTQVDGTLLEYLNGRGLRCVGVEAGGHQAPESMLRHQAVLWLALVQAGIVEPGDVPQLETHRTLLRASCEGLPRVLRVLHRHPIWAGDEFRMEPGFANVQRIQAGQLLARDRNGEIRAREDGVLVMPLYQPLGDDGFFLGREERPGTSAREA